MTPSFSRAWLLRTSFPERRVVLAPLACDDDRELRRLAREVAGDVADAPPARRSRGVLDLGNDPRIAHLADVLAAPEPAKLLVLCHSAAKALAIKAALDARLNAKIALFHEEMTLLQRDRSAAWFADPGGARLLIASEIGSEGRNFQHAHTLLMFDLPLDPDLVEQRIGRLDRIGQRHTVEIRVPFVGRAAPEMLTRWHHEGVDAFARPTLTARPLLERFGPAVRELVDGMAKPRSWDDTAVDALVADTADAAAKLARDVEQGRDRLLELASHRPDAATALLDEISRTDHDLAAEDLCLRVLDHFHVHAEEIGPRAYLLNTDGVQSEELPALGQGDTAVTFARETALVREDLRFLTTDHPLLNDAMELLLASESGNAGFALGAADGAPALWLEAIFVLESVAPARLHVDRFLAPTPVRIVVDQALSDRSGDPLGDLDAGSGAWLADHRDRLAPLLGRMQTHCLELAEVRANALREEAETRLGKALDPEIRRLRALARVNDHVRPAEIEAAENERAALATHLADARLRPDALRLIWQGPHRDGIPTAGR